MKIYQSLVLSAFLSTLSLRRATGETMPGIGHISYFYPRSPYGERPWARGSRVTYVEISIHALLTESDFREQFKYVVQCRISIHALLTESDPITPGITHYQGHFYPRSPYGERLRPMLCPLHRQHFYPRSPYGERPWARGSRVTYVEISIHALLTESDIISKPNRCTTIPFLSTLSLRRATHAPNRNPCLRSISIHALLTESDQ